MRSNQRIFTRLCIILFCLLMPVNLKAGIALNCDSTLNRAVIRFGAAITDSETDYPQVDRELGGLALQKPPQFTNTCLLQNGVELKVIDIEDEMWGGSCRHFPSNKMFSLSIGGKSIYRAKKYFEICPRDNQHPGPYLISALLYDGQSLLECHLRGKQEGNMGTDDKLHSLTITRKDCTNVSERLKGDGKFLSEEEKSWVDPDELSADLESKLSPFCKSARATGNFSEFKPIKDDIKEALVDLTNSGKPFRVLAKPAGSMLVDDGTSLIILTDQKTTNISPYLKFLEEMIDKDVNEATWEGAIFLNGGLCDDYSMVNYEKKFYIRQKCNSYCCAGRVGSPDTLWELHPNGKLIAKCQFASYNDEPGFSCDKAKNTAEKTICQDPDLKALDRNLNRDYRDLIKKFKDNEQILTFKKNNKIFITKRNKCKYDILCLKNAYTDYITLINKSLKKSP